MLIKRKGRQKSLKSDQLSACSCVEYLEVRTSPLEILDLSLDFSESLPLFMELLSLLFLLKQLLLIQLLPALGVVFIY